MAAHSDELRDDRAAGADDDLTAGPSLAELNNQLYRAYLSGDGVAVERTMALIEARHQRSMLASPA